MGSLKEMSIREYISQIDFKADDWKVSKIEEDMRRFLGEVPAVNVIYKKDVMVNEVSGKSKEIVAVEKVQIIFTDTDDHYKKIEFIIDKI